MDETLATRKISKRVTTVSDEIELRLRDGEKLDLMQLVHNYYRELHPLEGIMKVRGHLATAKSRLEREGVAVCLTGPKTFGVPTKQSEYEYGQRWYSRQIKGLLTTALFLHKYGQQHNLIPANMRQEKLSLPSFID